MSMKLMGLPGRHMDTNEKQVFCVREAWPAEPVMRPPGQDLNLNIVVLDKPEQGFAIHRNS